MNFDRLTNISRKLTVGEINNSGEHAWPLRAVARFLKEEPTSPSFGFFFANNLSLWRMNTV